MVLWYYPPVKDIVKVLKLSERFGTDIAYCQTFPKLLQQVLYTHDWRGGCQFPENIPVPHIAPVENLYFFDANVKLLAERSEQCGGLEFVLTDTPRLLVNNIVWEDHGLMPWHLKMRRLPMAKKLFTVDYDEYVDLKKQT
ncbi:hypothetical protein SPFM8_00037 [Salmonella phage SPFM8]|nr:hypothetical protein SPFM8_00037 [Salmonella phage SPFM8]